MHPDTGLGWFATAPLQRDAGNPATLGLRYARPNVSAGAISYSSGQTLDKLWLVRRMGSFTAGLQLEPRVAFKDLQQSAALASLPVLPSACLQYQPEDQGHKSGVHCTSVASGGLPPRKVKCCHF